MFKHVMAWSILAIIAIIFPLPGTAVFYFTIVTPCWLALIIIFKVMSAIFKSKPTKELSTEEQTWTLS